MSSVNEKIFRFHLFKSLILLCYFGCFISFLIFPLIAIFFPDQFPLNDFLVVMLAYLVGLYIVYLIDISYEIDEDGISRFRRKKCLKRLLWSDIHHIEISHAIIGIYIDPYKRVWKLERDPFFGFPDPLPEIAEKIEEFSGMKVIKNY